jgi:hypothetical protein
VNFTNIRTAHYGGAYHISINDFSEVGTSQIYGSYFTSCFSKFGGAIYTGYAGLKLMSNTFSGNSASQSGSDVYHNSTATGMRIIWIFIYVILFFYFSSAFLLLLRKLLCSKQCWFVLQCLHRCSFLCFNGPNVYRQK